MLCVCVSGVDVGGGDGDHLMGSGYGVGGTQGSAHSEVVVGLGGGDGDMGTVVCREVPTVRWLG